MFTRPGIADGPPTTSINIPQPPTRPHLRKKEADPQMEIPDLEVQPQGIF